MTFHWAVPLTAAVLNGALGGLVLVRDAHKTVNRLFALLSAMLVLWNLNIFSLYFLDNEASALFWSRVFRVGTLMAAPVAAHLFVAFASLGFTYVQLALVLSYALAFLLVLANVSGVLVSGVQKYAWGYYPVGTRLYVLVPISVSFALLLSVAVLLQAMSTTSSPRKRQQARLWLAGAAIAWPLSLTNLIPLAGVPFYPLGNFANVIYAGFIAYGIVRYRLMDIDFVITRSIVYAAIAILLVVPAFAAILSLELYFFGRVNVDFSFFVLAIVLCLAFFLPRLRANAEVQIERSLFRRKYEYRTALREFTKKVVRLVEHDELLAELTKTLQVTLELDSVSVFLLTDGSYVMRGFAGCVGPDRCIERGHMLLDCLTQRNQALLLGEVEEQFAQSGNAVREMFLRNKWQVCVGLVAGGTLLGFLALGSRRRGEGLASVELDLLETLAAEASIAIENARLYEELLRSRDVIQRTGRMSAIGTLAAGIAHEIRNPLVSVQTFLQLAPERIDDREFFAEFLGLAESEVRRICELITELLNLATSSTRQITDVEVTEIVSATLKLLAPQARKADVGLLLDSDVGCSVRADGDQLRQVFINIILNAIEATPEGGQVRVSVGKRIRDGRSFCEVKVVDNGCGISRAVREDVFTPFFTTKAKGTGLGLAVADQIMREHGGFILVDSVEGEGTSVALLVPAEEEWGQSAEGRREGGVCTRVRDKGLRDAG